MTTVKDGRFGVWFTLALTILILSTWVGFKLGGRAFVYRFRYQHQKEARLEPERARLEATLSELDSISRIRLFANVGANDRERRKTVLPTAIEDLERLKGNPNTEEISGVIDLNLGFLYVYSSIAEEQNGNHELAARYMNSAQPIFKALGWRDYSDETLQAAAQREIDEWNPNRKAEENAK